MGQSYTPLGRARTCPWISLQGKEWKALKDMRDAQVATLAMVSDIANSLRDLVETMKHHLEMKISSQIN